jgi:hypothetical protein
LKKGEKPKPTKQERIAKYLEAIPKAISGAGGHPQTFKVACALFGGWSLTEEETLAWLKVYNAKCEPPWSDKELEHKAKDAAKAKHDKPRGYLLNASMADQREEPDWSLPTKPIVSGKMSATFTTVKIYSPPYSREPFNCRLTRKKKKISVVNVVKTDSLSLVCPENDPLREKGQPCKTTEAQLVRVPLGLTREERKAFLARDLEEAFGDDEEEKL